LSAIAFSEPGFPVHPRGESWMSGSIESLPIRRHLSMPTLVAAPINPITPGNPCGRHHLRRLKVLAKLRLRLADVLPIRASPAVFDGCRSAMRCGSIALKSNWPVIA
jgi:hypothetical protein